MPDHGARRLKKLRITRVDRVGAGANPDAHIVLWKRADTLLHMDELIASTSVQDLHAEPLDGQPSEEHKAMSEFDRDAATPEVVAEIERIEAERDEAVVKADALEAEKAEFEAAVGPVEECIEDVLKSLPEEVILEITKARDERDALAERVTKMESDQRTTEFVAKAAAEFAGLGDPTEVGAVLQAIAASCDDEIVKTAERILKAAEARSAEADKVLTAELGYAGALSGDDAQRIDSLAKAKREITPTLSVAQSRAAVLTENPDLYERSRQAR